MKESEMQVSAEETKTPIEEIPLEKIPSGAQELQPNRALRGGTLGGDAGYRAHMVPR